MSTYSALDVANWFVAKAAESGDLTTHLKVQKLLYYAEAWTEVITDKELFKEQMQAWAHGPVVPEVYNNFSQYGYKPLPIPEKHEIPTFSGEIEDVLVQVFDTYGDLPAKTLEDMTHNDDPWIKARDGLDPEERCNVVMPKEEIKKYFKTKYSDD